MGCVHPVDKTAIREGKFQQKAQALIIKFAEIKGYVIETQQIVYYKFDIIQMVSGQSNEESNNNNNGSPQNMNELSPIKQLGSNLYEQSENANNFEELANVVLKSGLNIDNNNMKTLNHGFGNLLSIPQDRMSPAHNINIIQRNTPQQQQQQQGYLKEDKNNNLIHLQTVETHTKPDSAEGKNTKKSKFLIQEDVILLGIKNEVAAPPSNKTTQANIQGVEDHSQDGKLGQGIQVNCSSDNKNMINIDNLKIVSSQIEWNALKYAYLRYTMKHKTTTLITDLCRSFLETLEAQINAIDEVYKQANILDKCVKAYKTDMKNKQKNNVFEDLQELIVNCKKMLDQITITKNNLTQLSLMTIVTNTSNSLVASVIPQNILQSQVK